MAEGSASQLIDPPVPGLSSDGLLAPPELGGLSRGLRALAFMISAVMMIALVIVVCYEIVGRVLIPGGAAPWTGEVSDYLLVWITFLGASVAVADHAQPGITALVDRCRPRVAEALGDFTAAASLTIYLYLVVFGVVLAKTQLPQHSSSTGFSLIWVAAAIPAGASLMVAHKLLALLKQRRWRGLALSVVFASLGSLILAGVIELDSNYFYVTLFVALIIFLVLAVPVAESLLLSAALAYNLTNGFSASNVALAQHIYDGLNDFTFVAIPLFLLTGALMARTDAAAKLIAFVRACVGWLPGGLAVADIGASAVFADISGSAVADTVAIGTVMIPQLEDDGYPRPFASGLQSAAGTLGILYPPSISMLLYAAASSTSVAYLFASLLIPGLMVTVSFMVIAIFLAHKRGYGRRVPFRVTAVVRSFGIALPALMTIVIILGGLFSGIFTATEAGAVAAVYTIGISVFSATSGTLTTDGAQEVRSASGHTRWFGRAAVSANKSFRATATSGLLALDDGVRTTGKITFIIAGALAFGYLVVFNGGPQAIIAALGQTSTNPLIILVLLMLALLIIHTFLDVTSTILVIVPIVLPLLAQANINLGHFGVLVQLNSAVGQILPPVGINMYLVASLTGVSVMKVAKASLPFVATLAANLAAVLFFPILTEALPSLLGVTL